MSRPVLAALLLLTTPAVTLAQEDAAPVTQQDPQAAYNTLARDFGKAMTAWQKKLEATIKEARANGKRPPRSAYRQPTKEFVETAQELAQQFAGKEDAIQFLTFIVKNASSERNAVKWAVKTLASDHIESPQIGDALPFLGRATRLGARRSVKDLIDEVADNHAHPECQAKALLVRGQMRLERDDMKGGAADLRMVAKLSKDQDLIDEAKGGTLRGREARDRRDGSGDRRRRCRRRRVQAERLPRQGRATRLLGLLVTALPGDDPTRAVARGQVEGPTLRAHRRQQ